MTFNRCLVLFLLISVPALAQKTFTEEPKWNNGNWLIAFYGDQITNPGLSVAWEYAVINNVKTKIKVKRGKNRVKYSTHRFELAPRFTSYVDPQAHIAFIPNLGFQYKKINHHRWLFTSGVGIGMFSHLLQNVYEVNGIEVSEPKTILNNYISPSLNLAVGRVINKNGSIRGIHLGLNTAMLLNFNNSFQLAPAVELGYRL